MTQPHETIRVIKIDIYEGLEKVSIARKKTVTLGDTAFETPLERKMFYHTVTDAETGEKTINDRFSSEIDAFTGIAGFRNMLWHMPTNA